MKELTQTRRLTIASIILLLIILIGFITLKQPEYKYTISAQEMLNDLNKDDNIISSDQLSISNFILIDLRHQHKYNKGSTENAINIPVSDILNKDVLKMLDEWQKDTRTVVLFAENQRATNAPWMLLKQLGYNNLKILSGGYFDINQYSSDNTFPNKAYRAEQPAFDFAKFIDETSGSETNTLRSKPAKILPVKREKKSVTEGGC